MHVVRRLLAQRQVATLICAAALLLKLVVPAGYMVDATHDRIMVTICSGTASDDVAMAMPMMHGDMPDQGSADHRGESKEHGKAEMPCAFSGLSAAASGAIDAVQLVGTIGSVMTGGFVAVRLPLPKRHARLRPPPRGPPIHL